MAAAEEVVDPLARTPLLTVGIPVHNGRALFECCLRSVIGSTLPREHFEIVVADDGSSDPETHKILHDLEQELAASPGFCRVLRATVNSGGAARPRNQILDVARGEYVFFVDADDTIGDLSLAKIREALIQHPVDWVALHQVPVNGRSAVFKVTAPLVEVTRDRALDTLTVHKVFRRAEIERQGLRFDEGLPSGQDLAFAFAFIVNAARFLMLGDYDYYYLVKHSGNPDEPGHLSRRARTPESIIRKFERILRDMLTALDASGLPDDEGTDILLQAVLPRILIRERYLTAIVAAGPGVGVPALCRLSTMLVERPVEGVDPTGIKGLTRDHLEVIAAADWSALRQLLERAPEQSRLTRWVGRARQLAHRVRARTPHRQLLHEVERLQESVEELCRAQDRLQIRVADLLVRVPPDQARDTGS